MKLVRFNNFPIEAKEGLNIALGGDDEIIINEVEQKISQLYQVNGESWLITRIEMIDKKAELVIVCYQGKDVLNLVNHLKVIAKNKGIDSLRCHTKNKQFARIIENRIGANLLEYVYKLEL